MTKQNSLVGGEELVKKKLFSKIGKKNFVDVEYSFITIIPRSTLTHSGGTCLGSINGSKRTV